MPKKKTDKEYKKEIKEKYNDTIQLKTKYENSQTLMTFYCTICENEQERRATYLLNHGCPICNRSNFNKKRLEEAKNKFVKEFYETFPNTIIVDENDYKGKDSPLYLYCVDCEIHFYKTPANIRIRKNKGTVECLHKYLTWTEEMFLELFNNPKNNNGEYILMSEYKGEDEPIEIFHRQCNESYITTPKGFIFGSRCYNCAVVISEEKAKEIILDSFNGRIKLIEFNGWSKKCKLHCNDCNVDYFASPRDIIRNLYAGCEECLKKNRKQENCVKWKGGITPFPYLARDFVTQWKYDSSKFYGRKCIITGKSNNLVVHHVIKNFSDILKEVMDELGLELKDKKYIDFTEEEIEKIMESVRKKHYQYGYGVPLDADLHREFHSKYGNKNNTVEQFIEFAESKGVKLSLLDNYLIKGDIIDEDE